LHRSVDPAKDQSYVLGVLTPAQLAHAMFPLGASTKQAVRVEAAQRGLAVADKPDSHDICFIPDGDTAGYLRRRLGASTGRVVDEAGHVLREHDGTFAFTVGQRRGLHLGTPAEDGKPRYVLNIEPVSQTVTVGPGEALEVDRVSGARSRWCGEQPTGSFACAAQLRAHGEALAAQAYVDGDRVVAELAQPVRGVAPGQTLVLYEGTRVIGSATIESAERMAAARSS
jgi:tRNA-specific 2-thiouridylase